MSYLSEWEQVVKEIQAQIIHDLQYNTEDVFNPERVHWGARPTVGSESIEHYSFIYVKYSRSDVTLATRTEESHTILFELVMGIQSTHDPIEAENDKLQAIGVIYDAIREDNTLGGFADWAVVRTINARFRESQSYIFHDVSILIEVHKTW